MGSIKNVIDLPLFTAGQSQVTIGELLVVLAVLLATYASTRIADRALNRYLQRHLSQDEKNRRIASL